VVPVQEALAVPLVQIFNVELLHVVPEPNESLPSTLIVCTVLRESVDESFTPTGAATTVGVIVEVAVRPSESVDWYVTAVAAPVNALVHAGLITGVFAAVHGVNVTFVPDTAYEPCPDTTTVVAVQPGYVCPDEHNFIAVEPPE
jgi:hypothetical protein